MVLIAKNNKLEMYVKDKGAVNDHTPCTIKQENGKYTEWMPVGDWLNHCPGWVFIESGISK